MTYTLFSEILKYLFTSYIYYIYLNHFIPKGVELTLNHFIPKGTVYWIVQW